MQHLEVSCAVRPIEWPLGVKWLIIYQISCKLCVFINHKTRSPCTAAHQILYSALSTDILWTTDGRGGPVD